MIEDFEIADTGYPQLKAICDTLIKHDESPFVLDSRTLLTNPEKTLRQLCDFIGIDFDPAMLSWEAGPKSFEGVWAPHWYHNIHKSIAFKPYQPKTDPFPERLQPLLDDCKPYYNYLMQYSRT
jgi:hypothetical protein